ncbi:hypothetical protein [Metabacillus litoralis]|uniref:hypothetical protein n=1 Tax=Metabacillus litoralis TaxID=152268 RepID=UPI001CFC9B35|nr:hypothetical protein [Metabacillus litoralis]
MKFNKKNAMLGVSLALGITSAIIVNNMFLNNTAQADEVINEPIIVEHISVEEMLEKTPYKNKVKIFDQVPYEHVAKGEVYQLGDNGEYTIFDLNYFGKDNEMMNLQIINNEGVDFSNGPNVSEETVKLPGNIQAKAIIDNNTVNVSWSESELTYILTANKKALGKINENNLDGKINKLYNELRKAIKN